MKFLSLLLITLSVSVANAFVGDPDHVMIKPGELNWVDGPSALPAGAQIASLALPSNEEV